MTFWKVNKQMSHRQKYFDCQHCSETGKRPVVLLPLVLKWFIFGYFTDGDLPKFKNRFSGLFHCNFQISEILSPVLAYRMDHSVSVFLYLHFFFLLNCRGGILTTFEYIITFFNSSRLRHIQIIEAQSSWGKWVRIVDSRFR